MAALSLRGKKGSRDVLTGKKGGKHPGRLEKEAIKNGENFRSKGKGEILKNDWRGQKESTKPKGGGGEMIYPFREKERRRVPALADVETEVHTERGRSTKGTMRKIP